MWTYAQGKPIKRGNGEKSPAQASQSCHNPQVDPSILSKNPKINVGEESLVDQTAIWELTKKHVFLLSG